VRGIPERVGAALGPAIQGLPCAKLVVMSSRTGAFLGAIMGSIAGGVVGAVLGNVYGRRELSPIKREATEGAGLLAGMGLGAALGGAVGAGSCPTTPTP
jgi:hypothetical protein